ncbi:MAG: hypothetical protein ACXV4B_05900, partial [Halobacteriota archaeon]
SGVFNGMRRYERTKPLYSMPVVAKAAVPFKSDEAPCPPRAARSLPRSMFGTPFYIKVTPVI